MKYNTDKIKIKYILGTYKDSPLYPTGEDILFLMIKRALDRGESMKDISFTIAKLFKKIGNCNEDIVNMSIIDLTKSGHIEAIRETKDSQTYKIVINPYI